MADTDDQKPVAAPADAAAAEVPAGTLDAAAEAKKAKAKAKKKAAKAKKKSAAPPAAASGAAASSSSSGTSGTVDHPVRVPGTYEPVGAPSSAPPSALLLGEEASAELRHFAAAISLPSHDPSIDPDASKLIKKTAAPAEAVSHRFWSTQPVIQSGGDVQHNGPIDRPKTIADIDTTPVALKGGLEWVVTDVTNPNTLDEIYTLLTENYVEDDDNMFRFDYSKEFLAWALMPPGYLKQWHIGITWKGKLMAFISAIPAVLHVYNAGVPLVEINFLCVNKKLRSKRLAPTLIQEITRRVNLTGIWQAVYTAGRVLPTPVSVCRYYHRSLNPKKLIDVGFSHLAPRMTMARTIKLYKLPDHPQVPGIRPLAAADVAETCALLAQALAKYKIAPHFSEADFAHWFLPRAGVIQSYVVQDPKNNRITDFISFYLLPSTIIGNANYSTLNAAYSFYNFSTATEWKVLMNDALILAKNLGCDVFNALDLMENLEFLKELKFGIGDGSLHYYLYNWQCPSVLSKDLGLVLM